MLTQRAKQVDRRPMNQWEKLYLPAVLKGMFITLSHLFRKKVTIQYPEQKRSFPKVFRGLQILNRDEEGRERHTEGEQYVPMGRREPWLRVKLRNGHRPVCWIARERRLSWRRGCQGLLSCFRSEMRVGALRVQGYQSRCRERDVRMSLVPRSYGARERQMTLPGEPA